MDNMQLWLSSSTDSININGRTEGFYLSPDLEGLTGLPEIRSVNGLNAGYDGGWTATQLWAARLITIRGVIAINDKAAVETKRKALAKLLAQGKNEDLELRFVSEAGNTYTTTVRTTNCTMALQRVFWRQEYQIQLRANDPLIYDDGGSDLVAILRVMAGEGGFEIPFEIPFTIGGSIEPTSVDVGDEATYPLICLKGDLHNPTIINMTTNQRMQVLADIITTVEWRDYTTTYTTDGYKQIGDGLDGAPLSLTHLYGNATQETLSGKNLLHVVDQGSYTINGITSSSSNQTIKLTGTNTASANFGAWSSPSSGYPSLQPNTTYTISAETNWTSTGIYIQLNYVKTGGGAGGALVTLTPNAQAKVTFTVPSDFDSVNSFFVGVRTTVTTINNAEFRVQIEAGSTATAYEPYVGGSPMPNPQFPSPVETVTGGQTVKIVGKNIADNNIPADTYGSTATDLTKIDTGVNVLYRGTSVSSVRYRGYIVCPADPYIGKTLTLSAKINPNGTNLGRIQLGYSDLQMSSSSVQSLGSKDTDEPKQYTIPPEAEGKYLYLRFYSNRVTPVSQYDEVDYTDLQLELGSTATSYEPYQEQSQVINLGKNLFDQDNMSEMTGYYIDGSGAVVAGSGNYLTWLKLKPDTTYTLTQSVRTSQTVRVGLFPTAITTSSTGAVVGTFLSGATINQTFTTTSTNYWLAWVYWNGSQPDSGTYTRDMCKNSVQVEAGSQATSYSAYKTPIELAKIGTYQDYIWNDGGTWKVHKEVGKAVFDGTENWGTSAYGTNSWALTGLIQLPYDSSKTQIISNIFRGCSNDDRAIAGENIIYSSLTNSFVIRNTTFTTKASVQSATSGNYIYYALATPTDTEITDSELLEQLNYIYSLYQGTNNLWLIPSAGAQGEMEVSYATTEDIDYHEVVIDCQARTVTQDGHNLYPALAEGSEFIRLLPGENKLYLTSEVESDNGTAEVKFKKGNISI